MKQVYPNNSKCSMRQTCAIKSGLKILLFLLATFVPISAFAICNDIPVTVSETGTYYVGYKCNNNKDVVQIFRDHNGSSQEVRIYHNAPVSAGFTESNMQPGQYTYTVRACDYLSTGGTGYCSYSSPRTVTVTQQNNPPVITPSPISNRIVPVNTPVQISFTISDDHTPVNSLAVSISGGGNFTAEPTFQLSTSGATRTLTITPATGSYGSRVVQIIVRDQQQQVKISQFNFQVVQPPSIPSFKTFGDGYRYTSSFPVGYNAASGPVTYYDLDKRIVGASYWTDVYQGSSTSDQMASGMNIGDWQFRIRACHTQSSVTSCSDFNNYPQTIRVRPATPTSVAITDDTVAHDGKVKVSWSNPVLGDTTEIYGTNNSGGTTSASVSGTTWVSPALSEGNWLFKVRRCQGTSYCGDWTANAAFNVQRRPNKANVSAFSETSPSTDGQFDLQWPAQTFADNYKITQSGTRSASYIVNSTATGTLSYPIQVDNNGTYTFVVDACNGTICAGNGSSKTMQVEIPVDELPSFDYDLTSTFFLPDESIGEFVAITQGQVGVNNGIASYQVPIDLPPAVNNLKPSLAFNYSSSGNFSGGVMGAGWGVSGLSSITRCVKNKVQSEYITYTDSDRLCLDGDHLFRTDWTGYDRSGSFDGNRVFRTEIDMMVRIESNSNTTEFTAELKNGNILTYGSASNENNSLVYRGLNSSNPIKEWKLRKVEDRYGNSYEIFYAQNTTTGDHYISYIYYSPGASVVFNYETRDRDIHWGYDHGDKYQNTKLLKSVTTYINVSNASSPTTGSPVKHYTLDYDNSEKYRLKELAECGYKDNGSLQCARPLTFNWQDGEFGFGAGQQLTSCISGNVLAVEQMVDFNEDGLTDIMGKDFVAIKNLGYDCYHDYEWLKFPGPASEWQNPQPYRRTPPNATYAIVATNSNGGQRHLSFDFSNQTAFELGQGSTGEGFVFVSDPDNDGIPGATPFIGDVVSSVYRNEYGVSGLLEPIWLDLDGDGKKNLLVTEFETGGAAPYRTKLHYFRGQPGALYKTVVNGQFEDNGFETSWTSIYSPSPYSFGPQSLAGGLYRVMADLNGDGIKDIAYRKWHTDVNQDYWHVRILPQDGSLGADYNTGRLASKSGAQYAYVYDIDKDGDEEIILCNGSVLSGEHSGITNLNASGVEPQFATGSGSNLEIPYGCPPTTQVGYGNPIRGDFNNDGIPDRFNSLGTVAYPGKPEQPNLLTSVTDGFGRMVELEYSTLSPDIYTPNQDPAIVYPILDATRNMQVVKKLKVDAGTSNQSQRNETTYKYYGALFEMYERGFLGFQKIVTTDQVKNTTTTVNYRQDFPYIGKVSSTTVKAGSQNIKSSTYTWAQATSAQNGIITYLESASNNVYGSSGSLLSKSTETISDIDAYGNVGTITNTSKDYLNTVLAESVQSMTYSNNETTWLIGFVESTTTTVTRYEGSETDEISVVTEYDPEPGTLDVKVQRNLFGTPKATTVTTSRNSSGIVTSVVSSAKDYDGATSLPTRTSSFSNFSDGMYPQTLTNALNHVSTVTYDKRFGAVKTTADPNSLTSSTQYDALGRAVLTTDTNGNKTKLASFYCDSSPALIDCPGNAVYGTATFVSNPAIADAYAAPVSVVYYDRLQRKVRSEVFNFNGDIVKVDAEYRSDGNPLRSSEPFVGNSPQYWTNFLDYDVLDRPTEIEKPDGGSIIYTYDQRSGTRILATETATVSTPYGNETRNKLTYANALGQIVQVVDAENTVVDYEYNAQGKLEKTVVNNNADTIINILYDEAGNKTSTSDPDAGDIEFKYDGYGQLRVQTWAPGTANAKSITYSYDKLGRKTNRVDAGGSTPATYAWTWDTRKKGLLSTASGNGFTGNYYYNSKSQPYQQTTSLSGLAAKSFEFTYDSFGRPLTQTYPSGLTVRNEYHAAGAMVRTRNDDTEELLWSIGEASDSRGTLTQQIYGNSVVTERAYDPANGMIASILSGNAQMNSGALSVVGNVQNLSYTFDSIGNLYNRTSQRTNGSGTTLENLQESFLYDGLNRLTDAELRSSSIVQYSHTYDYDDLGNLDSRSDISNISYNQTNGAGVHGITTAGDTTYHYDAYGNLKKRVSASKGTDNLAYDAFNKPTQIGSSTFYYGPDHARYKQVNGSTTTYYFAGGLYEVEIKNGATTEKTYVGDYLVESKTSSETKLTYLHRDHLGSVDAMTDENGAYLGRMSFDAWGNRRGAVWGEAAPANPDFVTSRGFTGHEMLDDTKLVHMNGRVYDPVVGRFLSPDLFIQSPYNSQSFNRYSYVFNNPLSLVDPSGYLGADDIMYAAMESRSLGVAWSSGASLAGVQTINGHTRQENEMKAKQIVSQVRNDLGVGHNEEINININVTTGEAAANASCSAEFAFYGNGLGNKPTASVNASSGAVQGSGAIGVGIGDKITVPPWARNPLGFLVYATTYSKNVADSTVTGAAASASRNGQIMYHYSPFAVLDGPLRVGSYITPYFGYSSEQAIESLSLPYPDATQLYIHTFRVFEGQYTAALNSVPGTNRVAPYYGRGGGGTEFVNTVPLEPIAPPIPTP